MDEAKKYAEYGDTYYSGVCFEKAYLLAEELLQSHDSHKTFLTHSEREYLQTITGKSNDE